MADKSLEQSPLTDEQLLVLKMYLKVELNIEDHMIMTLVHDACGENCSEFSFGYKPETFSRHPETRDRFYSALMKTVKEEVEVRGMGAEDLRFPLTTYTNNNLQLLRTELPEEDGDPDAKVSND